MVISTHNIGKQFTQTSASPTFRLLISNLFKSRTRKTIKALSNISFDVREGEILGIIGGNGAGKSTLLKILAGTMWPTSGQARVRGRIGALIELGAGFHPDLTGRDNILLSATILGMTRSQATQKIDAILNFAELLEFADVPVRYYSSGMFLRLGFAVASFLDSDILLIDEALSVGDAMFKRKCKKLLESQRFELGKSALVVSHDLGLIQSLCTRAIVLDQGCIVFKGSPADAVRHYLSNDQGDTSSLDSKVKVWCNQQMGRGPHRITSGSNLQLTFKLDVGTIQPDAILKLTIRQDTNVLATLDSILSSNIEYALTGDEKVNCTIPKWPFNEGTYSLDLEVRQNNRSIHTELNVVKLIVQGSTFYDSATNPPLHEGVFLVEHKWTVV